MDHLTMKLRQACLKENFHLMKILNCELKMIYVTMWPTVMVGIGLNSKAATIILVAIHVDSSS